MLVVPNLELVRTKLVNHSFPDPQVRITLKFIFEHDAAIEKVKNILEKAVLSTPGILTQPHFSILVSDLSEAGVEFSVFFWVSEMEEKGKTSEGVRLRALQMFKDSGLRLARRGLLVKEGRLA
jgi:potassium efflux system protein